MGSASPKARASASAYEPWCCTVAADALALALVAASRQGAGG
jgi:hypothetical protein